MTTNKAVQAAARLTAALAVQIRRGVLGWLFLSLVLGCGGNPADRAGIGAQCSTKADCFESNQSCLTDFRGGYCGAVDCLIDTDCPHGAGCVTHDDGQNYCFRLCADKVDCNANRSAANEANCVGSIQFADPGRTAGKACVPPSSGI